MSIFDQQRLTNATFKLDIDRMRRGWYSDKYFTNIALMLTSLAAQGYQYAGNDGRLPASISRENINTGDLEVEMQWFTRRPGKTIVVGVDKALAMLRHCSGIFEGEQFIDTSSNLEVWAVHDGAVRGVGWQSAQHPASDAGARPLSRLCPARNPHPGCADTRQPGGNQCLRHNCGSAWQAGIVLPGPL